MQKNREYQRGRGGKNGKKNTSVIMCLCTKASSRACLLYVSTLLGCQANLNDLVGSEMCHKAALMDEGEHGANDTATSPRPHSLLMKALTPETATFNVPPMGGGGAREEHREVFRWLPESALLTPKHLAGCTSRRRENARAGE